MATCTSWDNQCSCRFSPFTEDCHSMQAQRPHAQDHHLIIAQTHGFVTSAKHIEPNI